MTATSEKVTSTICFTSAHATAATPPNIRVQHGRHTHHGHRPVDGPSNIAENTTAGAARIVPTDSTRDSRKRNAVRERVFASKRRSRYSYAV